MTRHVARRVVPASLVAAGSLLLAPVAAQQLVFRASTTYVPIDVVVTDGHDHAVTDLKQSEFIITDDKRPQTIADFKFVGVPPAHRTVSAPGTSTVTIDITTNHTPPQSRAFVVVIDDMHLLPQHLVQTQGVLNDIFASIPATDRVAAVFTGRSDLSVDFTTDIDRQALVIGRMKNALGFAQDPTPVYAGPAEGSRRQMALGSLDVLANVVGALEASRAERRAVIYVSEGFNYDFSAMPNRGGATKSLPGAAADPPATSALPGQPPENYNDAQDVFDQLRRLFEQAQRADVPIYTIDPRGGEGPDEAVVGWLDGTERQQVQSKMLVQDNFMRDLAEETGGVAEVRRTDLPGGVREILEDNSSYYMLGYYPNPAPHDGKDHDITVRVTRPGLHVRARKSYVAPLANVKAETMTESLNNALSAAVSVDGLQLSGSVAPVKAAAKGLTHVVTVEVTYPPSDARVDDELQLGLVGLDVEGKIKVMSRRAFHFTSAPRATESTFLIDDAIDLPPHVMQLRVGIASQALGKTGTLLMPLDLTNPADQSLAIGGVSLGLADTPAHPRQEPALNAAAIAPLLPFQPTTSRTFAAGDTLRVFAPVFWKTDDKTADVAVRVDGTSVAPTVVTLRAPESAHGHCETPLNSMISLQGLASGTYTLAITAHLPSGKTATRGVAFEIK